MNAEKIGFLILSTSRNRDEWKTITDSYIYKYTFKTLLLTLNKEHDYNIYIGIDKNDRIFDDKNEQEKLHKFSKIYKNIKIIFITLEVEKGHVTKMWNILFQEAYINNCTYFYQCGDDIEFKTQNWINDSITMLKNYDNVGITGPINNNTTILTQLFVSRKHMDIFGYFFPEEIKNWYCDDWINKVYAPLYIYPLKKHHAFNVGGEPRYTIDDSLKNKIDLITVSSKELLKSRLIKSTNNII